MDWFSFVILALVTWRVSSLLVNEDGPFYVFERIRARVGVQNHTVDNQRFLAQVLSCLWCCSIWVGAFWTLLLFLLPQSIWLAIPFALSAGTIFLAKMLEKLDT